MKNFIRNIKEHKKAALISLAVLLAVTAAAVLAVVFSSEKKTDEAASSGEENSSEAKGPVSYFDGSVCPVTVTERGQSLVVTLSASGTQELKWEHSCTPSGIVSAEPETEGTAYVLTPAKTGYTTLTLRQSSQFEGVSYDAVNIQAELTVYADEEGAMHIRVEDMRQTSSAPGAADSKTPFLLSGSRVIFPNGGDWILTVESDGSVPKGLYVIMPGTDSDGRRFYDVTMDASLLIDEKGGVDLAAVNSRLLLKSESLGIKKRIRCVMGADKELVLTEAEDEQ